jgi:hypothetical protein
VKGDRIHDPYDQQQHDDGYDVHVQHVHDDARQKVSAHRQHTRLIFRISNRGAVWAPRFFSFGLPHSIPLGALRIFFAAALSEKLEIHNATRFARMHKFALAKSKIWTLT